MDRNGLCWCQSGKKYKKCHAEFDKRIAALKQQGAEVPPRALIKNEAQMQGIRASAQINVAVLDYVAAHIAPGISTGEIDRWVYQQTTLRGGEPAPLGYEGFPKSVCTSVNDEVCHGIPSDGVILREGDIVNVDVSTRLGGYYSDSSRMFMIGEVSPEKRLLVETARESIRIGLAQVKPWGFLGDVGQAINDFVTGRGYSVVREIGGHGIGLAFHEDPWVSYVSHQGQEMVMAPGLCFTIEPMVNMGGAGIYQDADNGWTIYTDDGAPSAQWEIQVLVTPDGYEVIAH